MQRELIDQAPSFVLLASPTAFCRIALYHLPCLWPGSCLRFSLVHAACPRCHTLCSELGIHIEVRFLPLRIYSVGGTAILWAARDVDRVLGEYRASFSSTIDFKTREVVSLSANRLVLESLGGRSGVSGHPQAGVRIVILNLYTRGKAPKSIQQICSWLHFKPFSTDSQLYKHTSFLRSKHISRT